MQTVFEDTPKARQALTAKQLQQYNTDGYLLASGLIPGLVTKKAEKAMWNLMKVDPNDIQTWDRIPQETEHSETRRIGIYYGIQDSDLLSCATPEYILATAQLISEPVGNIHPPQAIHTQNLLPVATNWRWPKAHVDGIPKEHMHKARTVPDPSLVFLSDVEPRGGGTIVWPKSHRKIRELAESDPEKYT